MTTTRQFQLDRILTIGARPETVFSFFTDSARWAAWWGAGSSIEARPGGQVRIVHPGGVEVSGVVLDLQPPERIVFTYGYVSGSPIPPGGSTVTIRVAAHAEGTQLHLTHAFDSEQQHAAHVQGWRYQLSLFANAVANLVNADATSVVDRWFGAWNDADAEARRQTLSQLSGGDIRFRDRFSRADGLDELDAHLEATRRFMPGVTLQRSGDVRHCQGSALVDWVATRNGAPWSSGTNIFAFGPDGRIQAVTGFWK